MACESVKEDEIIDLSVPGASGYTVSLVMQENSQQPGLSYRYLELLF